ncbi:MAG TPA: lactonase family protein [Opitutaceae bacterium]|jgi:6-phosphogluconolactonase
MGGNKGTHRIFIGTYTKAGSEGIYSISLDAASGALGEPRAAAKAPSPTFLALSPDKRFLYAVCASGVWASSFAIEPSGDLRPVRQDPPGKGPTPCHVRIDSTGRLALAANYHSAQAAVIPLGGDGSIGEPSVVSHSGSGPNPKRQQQAHVHSAYFSPDGRFALVCDLGLDRIYTYEIGRSPASLRPGNPPYASSAPAAGPRHLSFNLEGTRAYVINELDSTIVTYEFQAGNGGLKARGSVSVLPAGYRGEATAAEVCVHPNGRHVFGSCRGPDTISVFSVDPKSGDLAPAGIYPCGGKGPRSFALSPGGEWLVCAHQDSNTLCSFKVDPETGALERVPGTVSVSMPVCVTFLD